MDPWESLHPTLETTAIEGSGREYQMLRWSRNCATWVESGIGITRFVAHLQLSSIQGVQVPVPDNGGGLRKPFLAPLYLKCRRLSRCPDLAGLYRVLNPSRFNRLQCQGGEQLQEMKSLFTT